jgi:hypothetical protein
LALPVALSALAALRLSVPRVRSFARYRRIEPWQTAAIVSLSFLPGVAVPIAKLVTHAFTFRYAIAALPGVCILLTIGYSRIIRYTSSWPESICHLRVGGTRREIVCGGEVPSHCSGERSPGGL